MGEDPEILPTGEKKRESEKAERDHE